MEIAYFGGHRRVYAKGLQSNYPMGVLPLEDSRVSSEPAREGDCCQTLAKMRQTCVASPGTYP